MSSKEAVDVKASAPVDVCGEGREACLVSVCAIDADLNRSEKVFRIAVERPLRELQAAWGDWWGIPKDVIGFELATSSALLSLDLSPKELKWEANASVTAVPLESTWAEKKEERRKQGEQSQEANIMPSPAAKKKTPICAKAAPTTPAIAARTRSASKSQDAAEALEEVAKKPAAPLRAVSRTLLKAAGVKRKAEEVTPAAKATSKADKVARKSDGQKVPEKPGKPKKSDELPGEDERIAFEQKNPKKVGSAAHARYEKYRKAKCIKDILRFGGESVDIKHDFSRGFFKRA